MSKKQPRYLRREDAEIRLHQTILRYKSAPVELRQFDGMLYRVMFLDSKDEKPFADEIQKNRESGLGRYLLVDANSEDIDVESPPTGYVNVYEDQMAKTAFLSRLPVRRYKQGLSPSNVSIVNDYTGYELTDGHREWPIPTKFIGQMIKNVYPTAQDALKTLLDDEEHEGQAFSRKLAFVRSRKSPEVLELRFSSQCVGFVKKGDNPTVSLLPDWAAYNILKSNLMTAGVFVA